MIQPTTLTAITTTAITISVLCIFAAFLLSAVSSVDTIYARERVEEEPAGLDWPGCDSKEQAQ